MDYVIVSAATQGSRYAGCISVQREIYHNHRYIGLVVDDRGSWDENTKIKPDAVRLALEFSSVALWIDSDCTIDPPIELPSGDWDICTMRNIHPLHKIKTSAGFILFRDTGRTRQFLDCWDQVNKSFKKDHPGMIRALRKMSGKLKVADMSEWLKGRHHINSLATDRGAYSG